MQTQEHRAGGDGAVEINEIPANREYSREGLADLDNALVEAIEKARAADEEFIAELLENQVRSLYFGQQF